MQNHLPLDEQHWLHLIQQSAQEICSTAGVRNEHVVLQILATGIDHVCKEYWSKIFRDEINKQWDAATSVGRHMVRVLKSALKLLHGVEIPSPGEFAEIIDDFGRYATMMNRLIQIDPSSTKWEQLKDLQGKVEMDWATCKGLVFIHKQSLTLPEVRLKDLEPLDEVKLGTGSYAIVRKGKWKGSDVAVKIFNKGYEDELQKEQVHFPLQALDSSHIIKFLGRSRKDEEKSFLVLELMDKNMEELKKNEFGVLDLVEMLIQIAKGMQFLHNQNVVHRDLKPKNILVRDVGEKGEKEEKENHTYLLKIADFGISKKNFFDAKNDHILDEHALMHLAMEEEEKKKKNSIFNIFQWNIFWRKKDNSYDGHTMNIGTRGYMAPEIENACDEGDYTRRIDVYSFGIICKELLEMEISNTTLAKLVSSSRNKDPLHRPCFAVICEELWIIMENLLAKTSIKAKPSLTDLIVKVEGDVIKVHFKLAWLYSITYWMRSFSNHTSSIIKMERSNGPSEKIEQEYKITPEDVGNVITIIFSVQYHCWSMSAIIKGKTISFGTIKEWNVVPH